MRLLVEVVGILMVCTALAVLYRLPDCFPRRILLAILADATMFIFTMLHKYSHGNKYKTPHKFCYNHPISRSHRRNFHQLREIIRVCHDD